MKEIILVKLGEVTLKGLNRRTFEDILKKNIKRAIFQFGKFNISYAQSTIYIAPESEDINLDLVCEQMGKIFGIAAYCKAFVASKNMDDITAACCQYFEDELKFYKTFKIEAKRSDKTFLLNSPEICRKTGEYILNKFQNLSVDVHNPDLTITVEIRETSAYIRGDSLKGAGGLPTGTGGKALVLISGGIDSPVAAFMMAKRGIKLSAVHFESPPYTSEAARLKVISLLKKVAEYSGEIKLFTVEFTKIQEQIKNYCKEELSTIIMRRIMMKIACDIACNNDCKALITGESLGQVASQTIDAIACTDAASSIPVFRPLIGMDKEEIIKISREIGTFDISIQPFEDCCTVFTPKHPRTRPVLEYVEASELKADLDELIKNVKITESVIYR